MDGLFYLAAALFFLALNAFFVLAEFAIVKVRYTRLEELAAKGDKKAKTSKAMVKDMEASLATAQLGITIASIGLGWVGEPAISALLGPLYRLIEVIPSSAVSHTLSVIISFCVLTGMHVILGEQVPKNCAIRIPEKMILWISVPFNIIHKALFAPIWLLNESTNLILKMLKVKADAKEQWHSEKEIKMILDQSQESGFISLGRLMMFEHLFDFGTTKVKEIMTPRENIVNIDPAMSQEGIADIIKNSKFSRYPIFPTEKMNEAAPQYYVHLKDIIPSIINPERATVSEKLDTIKRKLADISEEITIEQALRIFQERRLQICLVRGPENKITGLLSTEDIVEELTGEIRDEFDQPPKLPLSSILNPESCVMDIRSGERFSAIEELLDSLYESSPVFDKKAALDDMIKREKNFSTALGHNTAFPHARLTSLKKPLLAVGKSDRGIPFPSPDKQPVNVMFMILTPFSEPTQQLNILKELSGLISNPILRKRLTGAQSPDAIMDIICTFEDKEME